MRTHLSVTATRMPAGDVGVASPALRGSTLSYTASATAGGEPLAAARCRPMVPASAVISMTVAVACKSVQSHRFEIMQLMNIRLESGAARWCPMVPASAVMSITVAVAYVFTDGISFEGGWHTHTCGIHETFGGQQLLYAEEY